MNFTHSLFPLFSAFIFLVAGISFFFLVKKSPKGPIIRFCYFTFHWQFSWFWLFLLNNNQYADLVVRIGYSGIIFLPVSFYESLCTYLKIKSKLVTPFYVLSFVYLIALWTSNLYIKGYHEYYFGFYPVAGILHILYMAQVVTTMVLTFIYISRRLRIENNSIKRNETVVILIATALYSFAIIDYLLNYPELLNFLGVKLYPIGVFFIILAVATFVFAHLLSVNAQLELRAEEAENREVLLAEKNKQLKSRNAIISTFVRPSILNEIQIGQDPRKFTPKLVNKTVMICDIRNFTPLTSVLTNAESQAEFLNSYFELMIEPIFECGGEVDKLMGDAILANFPTGKKALDAVMLMREKLQTHNDKFFEAERPKISNVITIAKGETLEANIGAEKKLDRTWIGPAVNVCSRLEHVAKVFDIEVLVSEEIVKDIPDYKHHRLIGNFLLKGFDKPFPIYEIYGHQSAAVKSYKDSTSELLHQGIQQYFSDQDISEVALLFKQLLEFKHPQTPGSPVLFDTVITYYVKRCIQRLLNRDHGDLQKGYHDINHYTFSRDWLQTSVKELHSELTTLLNVE